MMNSLYTLKSIADELDRLGLYHQADIVDRVLSKYAQVAPPSPVPAPSPPIPTLPSPDTTLDAKYTIARTLFLKFKKLKQLYDDHLIQFEYLGTDNIRAILSAFDQFILVFEAVLRNKPTEVDNDDLQTFSGTLKRKEDEIERSLAFRPTPLKLKVDKGNFFDPLVVLCESLKRQYDGGLSELNPVVRRARALQNTFSNVLQSTSEQIAHSSLIDLR